MDGMDGSSPAACTGDPLDSHAPPVMVAHLSRPQDGLTGWVVVDSLADSRAMGGTRMTDSVTEEEVRALARVMTVKLAIAGLRIGGAKAGIRAVPGLAGRDSLLESFGRAVAPLLHGGIYLGSDQGITHANRDTFMAAAGFDVLAVPGVTRLPTSWATLWELLADITGFGVAAATLTALARQAPRGVSRVVIQGFGTVGRSVAKELAAHGHSIVAVADVLGTVTCAGGLPVGSLIEITDEAGTIDRSRLPAAATVAPGPQAWLDVGGDVLILAAGGGAIGEHNVHQVNAPLVVEAGNLCCTPEAKQKLRSAGVIILPDVVVNVGGAAATGCILTGVAPSGLTARQLASWLFAWVDDRVRRNCADVLDIADDSAEDPVPALLGARGQRVW
jgi:glutamate dehydrogenase (NAD(P)+)